MHQAAPLHPLTPQRPGPRSKARLARLGLQPRWEMLGGETSRSCSCLLDLSCSEQWGERREKMPLQNIWFERGGAISALLYRRAAAHKKTSVRGGQHSGKSGTRKRCVMSNTLNKRIISYSPKWNMSCLASYCCLKHSSCLINPNNIGLVGLEVFLPPH